MDEDRIELEDGGYFVSVTKDKRGFYHNEIIKFFKNPFHEPTPVSVVSFDSLVPRTDLLREVFSVVKLVVKNDLDFSANVRYLATSTETNEMALANDKFLGKLDPGLLGVFQLLVWLHDFTNSATKVKEIASAHYDYWDGREFHRPEDVYLYWSPALARWGRETFFTITEFRFFLHSPPYFLVPSKALWKRCEDEELRKFYNRVARISYDYYKPGAATSWEKCLGDVVVRPGDLVQTMDFHTLPLHHEEFREFVNSLTVEEFGFIVGNIPNSTPPKAAVSMGRRLVDAKKQEGSLETSLRAFSEAVRAASQIVDPEEWTRIYFLHQKNFESRGVSSRVLLEYFSEQEDSSVPQKRIEKITRIFLGANPPWIMSDGHRESVINHLRKLSGSPQHTVEIIEGISYSSHKFTLEEWVSFFDDWETYKDMPSELAAALV